MPPNVVGAKTRHGRRCFIAVCNSKPETIAPLSNFKVDLSNCDREPIHTPGSIQSHGAMLVCDTEGLITHFSANAAEFVGTTVLAGANLADALGHRVAHDLRNAAARAGGANLVGALLGVKLPHNNAVADITVHRQEGRILVELEAASGDGHEAKSALDLTQSLVRRISAEHDVTTIANMSAKLIRALLYYDRVMVYRFLHNGAGRVIAEARRHDMHSFLGQHFPAADIPSQARRLYLINWVRAVADVNSVPVPLIGDDSDADIDMSHSHLRSLSPIHCEYLRNMGVSASLSISIVVDGKLWGLIACHHDSPKIAPLSQRISAELFAQYVSLQIAMAERRAELVASGEARRRLDSIITCFLPGAQVETSLQDRIEDLAKLIACDGAALHVQNDWKCIGATPDAEKLSELAGFLSKNASNSIWHTHDLRAVLGDEAYGTRCAGVLAIPLSPSSRDYLMYFRSEEAHNVVWAGQPTKNLVPSGDGYRLTPRGSFEAWLEDVRGRSTPWNNDELAVAEATQGFLRDVVLRFKEATLEERARGDRHRRLLNDELNHRVKNIIALVKSIALQTGTRVRTVDEYTHALEGRLQALAFAHDQSLSGEGGNLMTLVEAEVALHRLGRSVDRVTTAGPSIKLNERAFSVLALLLHEMTTNAAKYGSLSVPGGKLSITWQLNDQNDCLVDWLEHGGPPVSPPTSTGFGSTLIRNTITYDLGGSAEVEFHPSGVQARFVIPAEHVSECPTGHEQRPALKTDLSLASMNVLIVEDQALIAMDVEDCLRQLGASIVQSVPTVREALLVIPKHEPDCAVLDLNLSGESSAAVADELAKRGVPFVFATGYRDNVMIPERFNSVPVVRKPINIGLLSEALIAALAART